MNDPETEPKPIAPLGQRVNAALLQTFAGAVSEGINLVDVLVEAVPIVGWAVSIAGGVGSYLSNKVEGLVLKAGPIFGNDPTRARLVATGGRMALIPMVGPYAAGVEDLVTMTRAWANVVAPEFVRDRVDPALNKVMNVLNDIPIIKLSPKDSPSFTSPNVAQADQGRPGQSTPLFRQPDGSYGTQRPTPAQTPPPPAPTPRRVSEFRGPGRRPSFTRMTEEDENLRNQHGAGDGGSPTRKEQQREY
jgi:hypothetical protein